MNRAVFFLLIALFGSESFAQTLRVGIGGALSRGSTTQPTVNADGSLLKNDERNWTFVDLGVALVYEVSKIPIGFKLQTSYGKQDAVTVHAEPFISQRRTNLSLFDIQFFPYYRQHLYGKLSINLGVIWAITNTNFKVIFNDNQDGDIFIDESTIDNKNTRLTISPSFELLFHLTKRFYLSTQVSYRLQEIDYEDIFFTFDSESKFVNHFPGTAKLNRLRLVVSLFMKM